MPGTVESVRDPMPVRVNLVGRELSHRPQRGPGQRGGDDDIQTGYEFGERGADGRLREPGTPEFPRSALEEDRPADPSQPSTRELTAR